MRRFSLNARMFWSINRFTLWCITLFMATFYVSGNVAHKRYKHDLSEDLSMSWSLDAEANYIDLELRLPEFHGWVAWGISETGALAGSDLFVVSTNGIRDGGLRQLGVLDMWADMDGAAHADQSQDWELLTPTLPATKSAVRQACIRLRRRLDTEDYHYDRAIPIETLHHTNIWYALPHHECSPLTGSYESGFERMSLAGREEELKRMEEMNSDAPQASTIDLLFDFEIPPVETTILCQGFVLPDRGDYIAAFEPMITSPEHVHHLHVHWCADNEYFQDYIREERLCEYPPSYDPDRSKTQCRGTIFTYTPGGTAVIFPPGTGLLAGTAEKTDSVSHVILEIHYDNPRCLNMLPRDHSGVRLWTRVAAKEAVPIVPIGLLQVADPFAMHTPAIIVPAKNERFETICTCPSRCTEQWSDRPLHVFASMQHMHKAGASIWTEVFDGRSGTSRVVHSIEYFDHEFQYFDTNVRFTLHPGDALTTHCIFNNTGSHGVKFGAATSDEMCMNVFYYYPRIDSLMMCGVGVRLPSHAYCNTPFQQVSMDAPVLVEIAHSIYTRNFGFGDGGAESSSSAAGGKQSSLWLSPANAFLSRAVPFLSLVLLIAVAVLLWQYSTRSDRHARFTLTRMDEEEEDNLELIGVGQ